MSSHPTPQRVNIEDLHYQKNQNGSDIVCTSDNEPFTGIVLYETSSDGSVISEYEVKNGLKDGVERDYYSEGILEHSAYYREGFLHGDTIFYYPEGRPSEKSIFEYNICTEEFVWNEDGVLIRHRVLELENYERVMLERSRREKGWQLPS